jgi:heterotetrameric sarcosine oxidase delta subunit
MSIRIPCNHCGDRPIEEYLYGEIFDVPDEIHDPDDRDLDRGFMHSNTQGPVTEAWFHLFGCRRWVRVTRDTRTDEILG